MDTMTTTTEAAPVVAVVCGHKYSVPAGKSIGSVHGRTVLATVLHLAMQMGHSDGSTYADCVACGEPAYVGGTPRANSTFNLGHVQAKATGGVYCVCNLLPLCRQCNHDMGDVTMTDILTPHYDFRPMWDGTHAKGDVSLVSNDDRPRGRAHWKAVETA